ncbi:MAG: NADH:quinone oxidoreductase [Acidimicrobiales bacterium]|nr:cation:proton antiporter subunit C [Hyphomonadaceae bacterium]RZV34980.1 MAG: NADH:quinone oxidoreductase [Acidimicrobiales bacterium]
MGFLLEHYNYAIVIVLMMTGLYVVFASSNMIKKLVGLSVFQTSVFLLYISIGKVAGGKPPIIELKEHHGDDHGTPDAAHGAAAGAGHADESYEILDGGHGVAEGAHGAAEALYSNPLPHVLILTAIVVGVATLAIGLALVVRTREAYGTIDAYEIDELDYQYNVEGIET